MSKKYIIYPLCTDRFWISSTNNNEIRTLNFQTCHQHQTLTRLLVHVKMQEGKESALYATTGLPCPHSQCGLFFKDQRAVKKHYRCHNPNAKIVKCKFCPHFFLDSLALQMHFAASHEGSLSDPQSQSIKRRKVANPVPRISSTTDGVTK